MTSTLRKIALNTADTACGEAECRGPGDSVDALKERIDDLWPSLVALREAMRSDLDLPGSPS